MEVVMVGGMAEAEIRVIFPTIYGGICLSRFYQASDCLMLFVSDLIGELSYTANRAGVFGESAVW